MAKILSNIGKTQRIMGDMPGIMGNLCDVQRNMGNLVELRMIMLNFMIMAQIL